MAISKAEVENTFSQESYERVDNSWQEKLSATERTIVDAAYLSKEDPRLKETLVRVRKAYFDYYSLSDAQDTIPGSFAFIVHPRDPVEQDIARQFPAMRPDLMDEEQITPIFQSLPPFILGEYNGLKDVYGKPLSGYVLSAPITVKGSFNNTLEGLTNAKDKTIATAQFAREKLGVEIVGLGETLGTLSKFGTTIESKVDDVKATTGHAYTVYLVGETLMQGAKAVGMNTEDATLAVVGAGGAIGASAARLLENHVGRVILIDKAQQIQRVQKMAEEMENPNVTVTNALDAIVAADLVISATNDPEPFIKSEFVTPGTVIVDDSQPVNMSAKEAQEAGALLLHPIGKTPKGVHRSFDFSLPEGTDFSCALEVMILAATDSQEGYQNRTVGRLEDINKVRTIAALADSAGFGLAPLQSFGKEFLPQELERIKSIRKKKS